MQAPSTGVESTFSRSWELLTKNWVIIVPGLVIGFIVGIIDYLVVPHTDAGGSSVVTGMAAAGGGLVAVIVNVVGEIVALCYVTGMAGAAWRRGKAELSDGSAAFQRDAGNTFIAMIGLFVVFIIAVILAIPTLTISLWLALYFFIYTFAAAIVGERPGFAAMADSFRISTKRVGPTLIIVVIIAVIAVLSGIVGAVLSFIPFLGPIAAAVLSEIVLAYVTLVVVGEYLALRDVPGVPPSTP